MIPEYEDIFGFLLMNKSFIYFNQFIILIHLKALVLVLS